MKIILIIFILILILIFYNKNANKKYINKKLPENLLSLNELSLKYGLDKSDLYHDYSNYYDKILTEHRHKKINFIEIGIGSMQENGKSSMYNHHYEGKEIYSIGNSLRCWNEYFYNANLILGIDIQKDCMFKENKIKTELGDSTNKSQVNKILNKYNEIEFDIILDDGLHTIDAQIKTLTNFWPFLKKGGIYFIEDIPDKNELENKIKKLLPNIKIHIQECNIKNAGNSYIFLLRK
jgi:hypothetical protein